MLIKNYLKNMAYENPQDLEAQMFAGTPQFNATNNTSPEPIAAPAPADPYTFSPQTSDPSMAMATGVGAGMSSNNTSQTAFQTVINQIQTKMQSNNKLINAKNAMFKGMYDQKLTPDEQASLTPELAHAFASANQNMISNALAGVNAQIKGYDDTISTKLSAYSTAVDQANKLKSDTLTSAMGYIQAGAPATLVGGFLNAGGVDPTVLGFTESISIPDTAPMLQALNNPGALKFVGQAGATMGENGFAQFTTPEAGYAALQSQIQLDASRGETLTQYITNYAPPSENNTALYIQQACQALGVSPDAALSTVDLNKLAQFQAGKESGATIQWGAPGQSASQPATKYSTAARPEDAAANVMDPTINATPGAVYQDALTYLNVGTAALSGMGLGQASQVQNYRAAVKAQAAAIAQSLGVDEYQARALFKANSATTTQLIERVGKIETTSATLQAQFPRLAQLADKVKQEGINITEQDIQSGSAVALAKFGSQDAASYIELIQTVRSDYAAMQAGVAGGKGSQFFAQNAADAIPSGWSSAQYLAVQQTIQRSSQLALDATKQETQTLLGTVNQNDQTLSPGDTGSTTSGLSYTIQ